MPLAQTSRRESLGRPRLPTWPTRKGGEQSFSTPAQFSTQCGTGTFRTPRTRRRNDPDRAAAIAPSVGAAAVAAAAAGMADLRQIHDRDRRTGLVHVALNTTALGPTVGSLALRRRGRRQAGRALSGAGWLTLLAGAYRRRSL